MDLTSVIERSLESSGLTEGGEEVQDVATETQEPAETSETGEAPGPTDAGAGAPVAEGDPAPPADTAASGEPAVPEAPAKRQGPIPFKRHEAILEAERTKHGAALKPLQDKLESLKWAEAPETQARIQAMNAANTHPELFARALIADERLGPVFKKILAESMPAPAAAAPAAATAAPKGRPGPNVVDKDGNPGYDQAGFDALLAWEREQAASAAYDRAMKGFEERYGKEIKPLVDERQQIAAVRADQARYQVQIEGARKTWEGFADNEGLIKQHLMKPENQADTLFDAYRKVVMAKSKADRVEIEKQLKADMAARANAGKGGRPAGTSVAAGPSSSSDPVTAAIERSIARLTQ